MIDEIKSLNIKIEDTKVYFQKYCKDKTISLDERWACFVEAPDCLKNHGGWTSYAPSVLDDNSLLECHCAPFYPERHQTFHTIDMLRTLEEYAQNLISGHKITTDLLDKFREQVLDACLGSFINDW